MKILTGKHKGQEIGYTHRGYLKTSKSVNVVLFEDGYYYGYKCLNGALFFAEKRETLKL
tara:strand:- start:1073 stop:1249 length:177 start_codon:yes stop_codon:yes gene_type:complete